MSASQHEYYIRQPSDTEARGPFTLAQLSDLARSGGFNSQTLYFDADADNWRPVADAPELAALIPPGSAKPRLGMSSSAAKLTTTLLFASGLALLIPAFGVLTNFNATALLRHPHLWLGVLDLLLALCCLAFGARFFRIVRIRAGLGIGFLGALFWLQDNIGAFVAALAASICLWLATALGSNRALVTNAIAGLAALAALAYCLLP